MSAPPATLDPRWQQTVDRSKTDAHWNDLDSAIQTTVADFAARMNASKTGFPGLDWHLVKAMVWTESGGPQTTAWTTRPMQIGNAGDPGLAALLSAKEGGDLILTPAIKTALQGGTATPELNIKAGVAYLLMRAAIFAHKSILDPTDQKITEVVVKPGDSIDKIARQNGSTPDAIKALNPGAAVMLKPGQKLRVQKASIQQVITGWQPITTDFAAKRYNSGDPAYRQKLDYCLSIMAK